MGEWIIKGQLFYLLICGLTVGDVVGEEKTVIFSVNNNVVGRDFYRKNRSIPTLKRRVKRACYFLFLLGPLSGP